MASTTKPLHSNYEKPPARPLTRGAGWPPADGVLFPINDAPRRDWWSVARELNYADPWDLIEYNFRTRDPREVNYYLRELVGCVLPTDDGKNWRFSPGADPGLIYYPRCQIRPKPQLIRGRYCPATRPPEFTVTRKDRVRQKIRNALDYLDAAAVTDRDRIVVCILEKIAHSPTVDDAFLHPKIVEDYIETDLYAGQDVEDVAWSFLGVLTRHGHDLKLEAFIELVYEYERYLAEGIGRINNFNANDMTSKIPHAIALWDWLVAGTRTKAAKSRNPRSIYHCYRHLIQEKPSVF